MLFGCIAAALWCNSPAAQLPRAVMPQLCTAARLQPGQGQRSSLQNHPPASERQIAGTIPLPWQTLSCSLQQPAFLFFSELLSSPRLKPDPAPVIGVHVQVPKFRCGLELNFILHVKGFPLHCCIPQHEQLVPTTPQGGEAWLPC